MSANASENVLTQMSSEARIAELEARLAEAEETLQAIRRGEVDALVVSGPEGEQIFALEGADHAYRVLVEEMQEGTVTLDADGLILYSNRQFASLMRMPLESVVGSRIQRFLPPERHALFSALLPDEQNRHKRGELTFVAAEGTLIPAHVSLNRLEVTGMQAVCVVISDLTEQRHYEAMVKDGELSRSILDQAAEAIVVIDARGKILRASESAQRLAGGNILLQNFDAVYDLRSPEGRVGTSRILSTAREGCSLRSVEVKLLRSNRAQQPLSLLLSMGPLWSGARELLGCVVTLTDITDRKRSEDALTQQAQALERSNNDLRQFAYAVSHDLREPTRILSIYTQLLERNYKGKLDANADEFIRHTMQAAQRLEKLLDDLLAYTQAAEAPQVGNSRADAGVALSKALQVLEQALAETGGRAENDPLPVLQVEEVHLQQLFQNLISNSLKYRGKEPPSIHVSARREKDMWTLCVADNGIGIDPQYHKQVFGLFKRLHSGGKYAGSGIGLAICHKIVERYGGRMWVDSEPGKGSNFCFTLPGE